MLKPIDSLTVQVLVDNAVDMLSSRPPHVVSELAILMQAGMEEIAGQSICCAQHGLSVAVTALSEGTPNTVLFDAGPDPDVFERNVRLLSFDCEQVDALVLSHGHFDHSEGLIKAVEMILDRNGGKPVPLHVHPGAFVKRAIELPDGKRLPLQEVPSRSALNQVGAILMECEQHESLLGGVFALSGEIPRNSFEKGMENQVQLDQSGEWVPDPWVMDERFMVAHIKDRGLVIITGCSHAGIINVCNHARELYPDVPLYALIGGLHLVYPNEGFIDETVSALSNFGFEVIVPGHCTGWRAMNALINAFGNVIDPLAVGTQINL